MTPLASAQPSTASPQDEPAASDVPLVIDLDGTLIRTDLLHESLIKLAVRHPASLLAFPAWLRAGKAAFKREVASRIQPDMATLPYEPDLVAWIGEERARGRTIVLCTASDQRLANAVVLGSGLFDVVLASDGITNLSGEEKARALVARFGLRGFDYAGNSRADLAVWKVCRRAIVVGPNRSLRQRAASAAPIERDFAPPAVGIGDWRKALRLHQWVKNLLVFLPILGAHQFTHLPQMLSVVFGFLSFGLCASSVYVVNDLVDLESDRRHARKRHRPFAAGVLGIPQGLGVAAGLFMAAFALAWWGVNPAFTAWLGIYFLATASYSLWLKRKMLVDSLVLAGLYTLRLLAGAAAAGLSNGFWLLAFSMFLFLSLAMVKRYSELRETFRQGRARTPGRDYMVEDLPLVEMLGIASGFCSVMVLALYINGDTIASLYPHQQVIWMTVPVLLYWISRIWLKAHRGELDDDPVVFALTDGLSRITILLFFVPLLLATW